MHSKRNRGFSLVELLLSLAIGSIIVLALFSLLDFTVQSCKIGEEGDEILLNGKHIIEFIRNEIRGADRIYSLDKFTGLEERFENNLGFVILRCGETGSGKYNYSTYYFRNDKIHRAAFNTAVEKLPSGDMFDGYNVIGEYVYSIEGTGIDFESKIIDLSIYLKGRRGKGTIFQSKLYIRSPIIY